MVRPRKAFQMTATVLVVLLVSTACVQADPRLLQNGDFSQGGASWYQLNDDDAVVFRSEPPYAALLSESTTYNYDRNGIPALDDGFSLTGIKQPFYLTQEGTVALSFEFLLTVTATPPPNETDYFEVLFDNDVVFSKSTDGLTPTPEQFVVSYPDSPQFSRFLNSGWHSLVFRLVGENDSIMEDDTLYSCLTDVSIKNVELLAAPAPGALLLGGLGFGFMGYRLRRQPR